MKGHRDLEVLSIGAVLCALVAALAPWELVRIVAAVPLTLFMPGYAIVAAAFGSREPVFPQRLTLSVSTSLMVLVLSTFLLNIPPFGLRTESWAVLLPVIVIAASRGAALRRGQTNRHRKVLPSVPRPSTAGIVLGAAAVLIAMGALLLAQRPLPAENAAGFAALWMLPTNADENAVQVGVVSSEQDPEDFALRVRVGKDGQLTTYRFDLDPGEERIFRLTVPPSPDGRTQVTASLYRREQPQRLYRRVRSWLPRQTTFP